MDKSYSGDIIISHDVYGKEHIVQKDKIDISNHFYGIAIKDDKILVSPQFDGFDFPGGTAEKGETHIQTLVREFKEETGLKIEPVKILTMYTSFFHHIKRNKDYQSYMVYYLVKVIDGDLSDAGFDEDEKEYAQKAKWVDIDYLKTTRQSCSLDIKDELIEIIINEMENMESGIWDGSLFQKR